MTTVGYDGDGNQEMGQPNPQPTINPLPFRTRAIMDARECLHNTNFLLREGEHIDVADVMACAATLSRLGKPEEASKKTLGQHMEPLSISTIVDILNDREASKETDISIYPLTLGLSVAHRVARLQSAWYWGTPPRIDPELIPTFLAECRDDMRDDENLGGYVDDQLEIMMSQNDLYEPDEIAELRTLNPDQRKPLRRGITKSFTTEQMRGLRAKTKAWTENIADENTDMYQLATLIEEMRYVLDITIDDNFKDIPANKLGELKFTYYHLVNLGFYFAYWVFLHDKGVRELTRTLDEI